MFAEAEKQSAVWRFVTKVLQLPDFWTRLSGFPLRDIHFTFKYCDCSHLA
jgi:hypothetical protein